MRCSLESKWDSLLTPAEKLKVQPGAWPAFFRRMSEAYSKESSKTQESHPELGDLVDTARAGDFKLIAQLSLLIIHRDKVDYCHSDTDMTVSILRFPLALVFMTDISTLNTNPPLSCDDSYASLHLSEMVKVRRKTGRDP